MRSCVPELTGGIPSLGTTGGFREKGVSVSASHSWEQVSQVHKEKSCSSGKNRMGQGPEQRNGAAEDQKRFGVARKQSLVSINDEKR